MSLGPPGAEPDDVESIILADTSGSETDDVESAIVTAAPGSSLDPAETPAPSHVPADDVPVYQADSRRQAMQVVPPVSTEAVPDGGSVVSIQTELSRIVSDLRRSIPELHGAMVASVDGLSVAHDFPEGDADRTAAMAATALGLGQRISDQTSLGEMQETVVRGDRGYMVVYSAGDQAVLVLVGPFNANLGLMRIEARAASTEVNKLLG